MTRPMAEYLKSIEQFLQREEDFLLYTPDPSPEPARTSALPGLRHYILEGQTPRLEEDVFAWGLWCSEHEPLTIALTQISPEVDVSTVFLGLDCRLGDDGPPLLFETMIFGGPSRCASARYATWDEALAGHHGGGAALRGDGG